MKATLKKREKITFRAATKFAFQTPRETAALKVENVAFEYAGRDVLTDVSFELKSGEIAVLIGPNGTGKTTLLRLAASFLKPKRGEILLEGVSLKTFSSNELARRVAYMPQRCAANGLTVFDALLLGRKPRMGIRPRETDYEIVDKTLNELNLQEKATRPLDKLSGGELQKVALGRIFVQEPRLLLLDEPTSALDLKNKAEIGAALRRYVRRVGATVLTSAHDLNDAFRLADRLLFLKNGRLIADATPETATARTLSELYETPLEILSHRDTKLIAPTSTPNVFEQERQIKLKLG